jgi:hypothetical protein
VSENDIENGLKRSAPYSLAEMRAANGGRFSDTDYIHYVLNQFPVGPDLIGSLFRFINPEFEEIEGRLLLVMTGSPERYRKYRSEGKSPSDAQYWANLTEISGLFGEMDYSTARMIAGLVAGQWETALAQKSQDPSQKVRILKDNPEEVFVTISTT